MLIDQEVENNIIKTEIEKSLRLTTWKLSVKIGFLKSIKHNNLVYMRYVSRSDCKIDYPISR